MTFPKPAVILFRVALCCGLVCFGLLGWMMLRGFGRDVQFENLPGPAAHERQKSWTIIWPEQISPDVVKSVSFAYQSTLDSSTSWIRIELPAADAEVWAAAWHKEEERIVLNAFPSGGRDCEGLHRTLPAWPPFEPITGPIPAWWSPPNDLAVSTTEIMLRGGAQNSRVTLTGYDPATQSLWICSTNNQHHELWKQGERPEGNTFGSAVPAKTRAPLNPDGPKR